MGAAFYDTLKLGKMEQNIIEQNHLIALFMGFKEEEIQAEDWCGCNVFEDNGIGIKEMLPANYEENWSRLMPVVGWIERLGYTVQQSSSLCAIISTEGNDTTIFVNGCNSRIEATYKAVVQFITWHNSQP